MRKRIAILGSTGSIGVNALRVADHLREQIEVVGIAAGSRVERMAEQVSRFGCRWAYAADPTAAEKLRVLCPGGTRVSNEAEQLCEWVAADDIDLVLCAIVGTAGLPPVLAAIRAGKDIALASKEVLVLAGEVVTAEARRCGVRILPVDSEHCALFQCLEGGRAEQVQRLILTASGGPFRQAHDLDLWSVTPEQALAHPTWNMGAKVTIDSATLMNKGLEVIEARWLFDMPPSRIDTVVHPESVVHSLVEFIDGSILAQLGHPDMCLPIQYCLTYPVRHPSLLRHLDFSSMMDLHFEPPCHDRFPAIRLAKLALTEGGTMPAAYNAANEVAVDLFCAGSLPFPGIWEVVERVLEQHRNHRHPDLACILDDDRRARVTARTVAARIRRPGP